MARGKRNASFEQHDLFDGTEFTGFGPSRFHPDVAAAATHSVFVKSLSQLRDQVRQHAPKLPGVYGMLNAKGKIVYVGKAKSLRTRLLSYFRTNSRDPKAGRILRQTRVLVWEQTADEFSALLRELELIQRFRPRMNVVGQPGRRRYRYLCVGREPARCLYVAREPNPKDLACYGPFVGQDRIASVCRWLNDAFGLRDCSTKHPIAFADQPKLFPTDGGAGCLRYELGSCLGPCAGFVTRRKYGAAVRALVKFLDGHNSQLLEQLHAKMLAAAQQFAYERAGVLRDQYSEIAWVDHRLSMLRRSRNQHAFVYKMPTEAGQVAVWYLLNRGQVWAAVHEPTTLHDMAQTADLIEAVARTPLGVGPVKQCVDSILLVAAWLKKHPMDKANLVPAAEVVQLLRQPMLVVFSPDSARALPTATA